MNRNELYHFGVPGMKWGVRRYQKKNGSLTRARKKRYGSSDNDSFVLRKGTTAYRIANEDDDLTTKKGKYVSITDYDRKVYSGDLLKGLFLDYSKSFGEHTLNIKKDLKTKRGEAVISDLIDKYGGESSNSLKEQLGTLNSLRSKYKNISDRSNYIDNGLDDWDFEDMDYYDAWSKSTVAYDSVRDFAWNIMKDHGDEIVRNYKESGYDAIVDPYDYIANVSEMPVIVLDPASSLERKSYRKMSSH